VMTQMNSMFHNISGFNLFMKDVSEQRKKQNPDVKGTQLIGEIGQEWKSLSPHIQEQWRTKAKTQNVLNRFTQELGTIFDIHNDIVTTIHKALYESHVIIDLIDGTLTEDKFKAFIKCLSSKFDLNEQIESKLRLVCKNSGCFDNTIQQLNYYGMITGYEKDEQYKKLSKTINKKLHTDEWIIFSIEAYICYTTTQEYLTLVTNYGSFFFSYDNELTYYEGVRKMPEYMIDVVQRMLTSSVCSHLGTTDDSVVLKEHVRVGPRQNPLNSSLDLPCQFTRQNYVENLHKFICGVVGRIPPNINS
jgi:hypothetical protein